MCLSKLAMAHPAVSIPLAGLRNQLADGFVENSLFCARILLTKFRMSLDLTGVFAMRFKFLPFGLLALLWIGQAWRREFLSFQLTKA